MVLAGIAALWLVKRLCGRLTLWDAVVPLLFLTTSNAETYVLAPNVAHGPLPALLLIGYALGLTIQSHPLRCVAIVVLNFFCVNTGFTWLLGGVTPVVLLLLAFSPRLGERERTMYGAAVVASIATVAFFLYGFTPQSATECFQFPHARPSEYLPYMGFVLGRPFGLSAGTSASHLAVGAAVALGMMAFVGYAGLRMVRTRGESALWLVVTCLAGFALLFAASTSIGRVCLGFDSSMASRYITYMLPGLLAMYLVLRSASIRSYVASALLPVFLVACIVKERDELSANEAAVYRQFKQRWRDCYLSTHDIDACDTLAGHAVYPRPQATRLQQKLDWLEARGFSLFQADRR
jgi:hypothetical protein